MGKLGVNECEASSEMNANSRSTDGVDITNENNKEH